MDHIQRSWNTLRKQTETFNPRLPLVTKRLEFNKTAHTPWKINMEPENDGLEDDFPLQLGDF